VIRIADHGHEERPHPIVIGDPVKVLALEHNQSARDRVFGQALWIPSNE
jgi:hypothetical protein